MPKAVDKIATDIATAIAEVRQAKASQATKQET